MTAALEILAQAWPFLLAAAGVLFGWVRHKQAQATVAQAGKQVAEAESKVAAVEKAEAEANAAAARGGAEAAKERTNVENGIAAGAPGESAKRLRDQWSRD